MSLSRLQGKFSNGTGNSNSGKLCPCFSSSVAATHDAPLLVDSSPGQRDEDKG